jgi:uncharacterized repeat protein (TIGR01451 family)
MNRAHLKHGSQLARRPVYDTPAKEARMSRLNSGSSAENALRTELRTSWVRFALGLQALALVACSAVGCSSVGGGGILNNKHKFPSQTSTAPVAMSLRDGAPRTPATPQRQIAQVSYQEPVASAKSGLPVAALLTPNATTASFQTADGCATATGANCGCMVGSETPCIHREGQQIIDMQEYLFDGGDLDPALVVRNDASVAGLNPTDTLAYYETYDGKLCVVPTNRVPIYAPRFGAVRQITGIVLSEQALATERILAPVSPSRFEDKNLVSSMMQPVAPQGEESVSLIDAFRDRNLGVPMAQVFAPHRMSDAIVPFEAIDFFRTGILKHEDMPVLGQFLQNAKAWETPESLEVLVDGQETALAIDTKQAQDVHVYELPPGKCSLRICKAASQMIANSGDQITFTIRFDNIGTQPVEKVVILDSLSPRLEYIQESQQSSVAPAPEFSSEPNEVGSTVLKWEFKSSLKPGEGGVLHFRCLVR